jgi:hypothetical protein
LTFKLSPHDSISRPSTHQSYIQQKLFSLKRRRQQNKKLYSTHVIK